MDDTVEGVCDRGDHMARQEVWKDCIQRPQRTTVVPFRTGPTVTQGPPNKPHVLKCYHFCSVAGPSHEPLGIHSSAGHSIPVLETPTGGEIKALRGGVRDVELMA